MVDYETEGPDREIGVEKEGRKRGLVKFLRDAFEQMKEEDEGRVSELKMGSISWNKSRIYTFVEYGFNERSAEPGSKFVFMPAYNAEHGGTTRQGSDIQEFGGEIAEVGTFIEALADLPLEFAELDAASQGHSNLTDYEFEYETAVSNSRLEDLTFEEVAEEAGIL